MRVRVIVKRFVQRRRSQCVYASEGSRTSHPMTAEHVHLMNAPPKPAYVCPGTVPLFVFRELNLGMHRLASSIKNLRRMVDDAPVQDDPKRDSHFTESLR